MVDNASSPKLSESVLEAHFVGSSCAEQDWLRASQGQGSGHAVGVGAWSWRVCGLLMSCSYVSAWVNGMLGGCG